MLHVSVDLFALFILIVLFILINLIILIIIILAYQFSDVPLRFPINTLSLNKTLMVPQNTTRQASLFTPLYNSPAILINHQYLTHIKRLLGPTQSLIQNMGHSFLKSNKTIGGDPCLYWIVFGIGEEGLALPSLYVSL